MERIVQLVSELLWEFSEFLTTNLLFVSFFLAIIPVSSVIFKKEILFLKKSIK